MEHMHSTDDLGWTRMDRLQISPEFSDIWPSSPLVEWPEAVREFFFESLEVVVRHEGRLQ